MGARIRLITVVVVAAMTVGVTVAFGEGRLAGSHEEVQQSAPSLAAYEEAVGTGQLDLIERAVFRNALDRAGAQSQGLQSRAGTYLDAHERGMPVATAVKAPTTEVGANIEWPQIGIGFGVGILLAIGILLAVRTMRVRPLAH